jgi:tetratricopeptide (TPR) repeat protein
LGIEIDFRGLDRRINENKNAMEAFPEIYKFNFPSNDDFRETMDILKLLWNKYPRKEFGGKSPGEVCSIGPKEQLLISDLLNETMKNVDPDDFPSIKEAEKAVDKFRDLWLKTPQEELDGRTPVEAILEERREVGNPNKNFTFGVKIEGIRDYDVNKAERLYVEEVQALEQGALIKAAELFEEVTKMYPENYRAWGNLGCCFAYLGDKKEAIKCYKKALSIEPDYEFARESLDWVKGQTEKQLFAEGMLGTLQALKDDLLH